MESIISLNIFLLIQFFLVSLKLDATYKELRKLTNIIEAADADRRAANR